MMTKKEALVLGAAVIGGAGLGLMILGKGKEEGEGGEEEPERKKEMLIRYEAPVYAPSEVYAPYRETNITDIIHNIITRVVSPLPTPDPPPSLPTGRELTTAGRETRAGGYGTPTYWEAKIAKKQAALRVDKGGYMGSGMTQSEYKSQFAHRTYGTSPTGQVVKPKKITSYPAELAAQAAGAPGATSTSYDPCQG
jgi:hypothetical protein